jgi:hypothetical protein
LGTTKKANALAMGVFYMPNLLRNLQPNFAFFLKDFANN